MNKTYQEILEILKNKLTLYEFAHDEYNNKIQELGTIEEVQTVGGEGKGNVWSSIKYFKDHNVYIKISGYYSSYSGTEFDGWDESCSEVFPKQKTIMIFEKL